MSNKITATADAEGKLVLDIAVESAVNTFTWVILDKTGAVVAGNEVDRSPTDTGVPLGQEFSVIVTDAHRHYWDDASQKKDGPAQPKTGKNPRDDAATQLDPGNYQVQLYGGRPLEIGSDKDRFAELQFLDEDAFSVLNERVVAPLAGTAIGHPLHVALVREAPTGETERRSPVTYTEFRKFLEARWGKGEDYDDANSWPAFGDKPFEALRTAARDFVSQAKVTSFGDLLPPGYVEGKLKETKSQFPRITLPEKPRTSYLPGVELIWNYWLEEGMLVQTLNVILARFQNRRLPGRDPLVRFDVTPLMPLRNRLWGFAEDESHRLTVRRRAVEYEYEYGFSLIGKAVPRPHSVVERRNGFIATFHQVLFLAHRYFKELDDLTVQADAFPLYRALRDCHIVLSQGTQNQYGEMAVAARAEFLLMQTILAEPQMREFLGGRPMTPYDEPWMDRVDSMKTIQGWTDTSIMHFHDLATIGEQLVLTIRLGKWADGDVGAKEAATWAQAFRYGIQKYAAAYRTATGVDLAEEPNSEKPSTLLARRLSGGQIRA